MWLIALDNFCDCCGNKTKKKVQIFLASKRFQITPTDNTLTRMTNFVEFYKLFSSYSLQLLQRNEIFTQFFYFFIQNGLFEPLNYNILRIITVLTTIESIYKSFFFSSFRYSSCYFVVLCTMYSSLLVISSNATNFHSKITFQILND